MQESRDRSASQPITLYMLSIKSYLSRGISEPAEHANNGRWHDRSTAASVAPPMMKRAASSGIWIQFCQAFLEPQWR